MLETLKGPGVFSHDRITPPARPSDGEAIGEQLVKNPECQKHRVWTWYRESWEVTVAFKQGVPCHLPRHCTGIWKF